MANFIIIGLGRFGVILLKYFVEKGASVFVIDRDKEKINELPPELREKINPPLNLDAARFEDLKEGLKDKKIAAGIVTLREDFGRCIHVCKNLKKLGIPKVITLYPETEEEAEILKDIGLKGEEIISLEKEAAKQLVSSLTQPGVLKHLEIEDFNLSEVIVPKKLVGKKLHELELREKYKLITLRIRREENGEIRTHRPSYEEVLQENDVLIVEGDPDNVARFEKDFAKSIKET